MKGRLLVKRTVQTGALALVYLPAALSVFGRFNFFYTLFSHSFAMIPGIPGNFLRAAFYKLTLWESSIDTTISFGTFFAHPGASIGANVSIGSYCVIGKARIGSRTQIASHVEIPSGAREHTRDKDGKLSSLIEGEGTRIGEECWIGASAVILAEVGAGSTIGAGSVVVKPIPPRSVAVGNPARVIRSAVETL